MILRSRYAIAAFALTVGLLAAIRPSMRELATLHARSGQVREAIKILEHAPGPKTEQDLLEDYDRAGRGREALRLFARRSRLSGADRGRIVDLARRHGEARAAVQLLSPYVQLMAPRELPPLIELALGARDLPVAVSAQRRLCALRPTVANQATLVELCLQAGDPKGALAAIETAGLDKRAPGWHRRAAQLAEWSREPGKAIAHLRVLYRSSPNLELGRHLLNAMVAARDPELVDFAYGLALAYPFDRAAQLQVRGLMVAKGRPDKAIELARRAVTLGPADPQPHRDLVELSWGQGHRAIAIQELKRWLGLYPLDDQARHQLAQSLVWDGRSPEAWSVYAQLLSVGGTKPLPRPWREEWLAITADADLVEIESRVNLRALVAMVPGRIDWLRRLALAEHEAGDRDEAIQLQRRVVTHPQASLADTLQLATWLHGNGQVRASLACFRQAAARHALPPGILGDAAANAERAEDWDDAAFFLERLVERSPRDGSAWQALAQVRDAHGDVPGAVAALQTRIRLGGVAPWQRLELVSLLRRMKRPDLAFRFLEQLGPAASLAELRELAVLSVDLGRPEEEIQTLRDILRRAPTDGDTLKALADRLDRMGKTAEADRCYAAALRLEPENEWLWAHVAARRVYGPEPASAGPLVARLRQFEAPSTASLRIMADYFWRVGQFRDAWHLLDTPLLDESLRTLRKSLRDDGADRVTALARHEASSGLTRDAVGLEGVKQLSDRWQLRAETVGLSWGGPNTEQVGLEARWHDKPVAIVGRFALASAQSPLGGLRLEWNGDGLTAHLEANEDRWEETAQTVSRNGRERSLAATVTVGLDPRLSVRGTALKGQLALNGQPVGDSDSYLGEIALRPDATSPYSLSYQFRHRGWGSAGALVGLPTDTNVHSLSMGFVIRQDAWRFDLQPGYGLDANLGVGAPTLSGAIAWSLESGSELRLSGAWSGRSFAQGDAGTYQQVQFGASWWF